METPIHDFLRNYSKSGGVRLHMPGHKGRSTEPLAITHDITEIYGADSLFEAEGIISQSEKNASKLFGSGYTCFSAGGSTLCIQTMLALAKLDGRNVIAVRNVHRSFIAACVLLEIEPRWVYPMYSAGFLSGSIDYAAVEKALGTTEKPCLYVTSPDYLGRMADIKKLSSLCHKYGGILIVDNAHGAHFAGQDIHPIKSGADMCCDSAHKMLPALTGAAYLHIGENRFFAENAKQQMSLFGSTSPGYLVLESLDLCNDYIEKDLARDRTRVALQLEELRESLSHKYKIYEGEAFHLTLLCDGKDLAGQLRERNIECEYADDFCIVLLFSPFVRDDEIKKTKQALLECKVKKAAEQEAFEFPKLQRVMTVREAGLSAYRSVGVEEAEGCVCASLSVPCPPAVPIAVPGEKITSQAIKIYKRYGIERVNVVK